MKRLRYLIITLFSLLMSASQAWALPYCEGDYSATAWDNCFGKVTWANGDQYIGDFKNGTSFGWGAYTSTGGRRYVGDFKYGKSNGHGTYTWPDGAKYIGEFKDNKRNGWGKFTYANGATYLGEFKGDQKNGQGTAIYVDGSKYIGEFKSNKWEGQGTHTAANGTIREGKWLSSSFQYHRKGLSINNQNTPLKIVFEKNYLAQKSDEYICSKATFSKDRKQSWTLQFRYKKHITEAKRRGLSCGVSPSSARLALLKTDFERLSVSERNQIQSVLKVLHLYYGSIDGIWGPNTQKAILKYASNNGIKNTDAYRVYPNILATKTRVSVPKKWLLTKDNKSVCLNATKIQNGITVWETGSHQMYADEAKRRDLSCGVDISGGVNSKIASGSSSIPKWALIYTNSAICTAATIPPKQDEITVWDTSSRSQKYVNEAKRRGLSCGVGRQLHSLTGVESITDIGLCADATYTSSGKKKWMYGIVEQSLVNEAKRRGLSCGVAVANETKLTDSQEEEIKRLNLEAKLLEERNLMLLAELKLKDRERLEVEAKKIKEDQSKGDTTLKKIALIIGNYSYKNQNKLTNPPNDVRELKKKLLQMGFKVTATKNLKRKEMVRALSDFGRKAQKVDYALFYFSGHGIELNGNNYMIPVDATLERDDEVEYETVNLETILTKTMASKKLGIVLIDACRTNPFLAKMAYSNTTRSISRGLAKVEARENLLISFAASPGDVASDGLAGGNSPYAAALIEHLDDRKEVGMLFRKIGDTVRKLTDNVQRPMLELDLSGDEFFLSK